MSLVPGCWGAGQLSYVKWPQLSSFVHQVMCHCNLNTSHFKVILSDPNQLNVTKCTLKKINFINFSKSLLYFLLSRIIFIFPVITFEVSSGWPCSDFYTILLTQLCLVSDIDFWVKLLICVSRRGYCNCLSLTLNIKSLSLRAFYWFAK